MGAIHRRRFLLSFPPRCRIGSAPRMGLPSLFVSANRRKRSTTVLVVAALVLSACGASHHPPATPAVGTGVAAAVRLCDPGEGSSLARARECYQRRLLALVSAAGASATELPQVDAAVEREGGFLADNCHILMHWVGRNYALEHHVTLGTLQTYLPRTNDPGCSAGFAHGLISALGSSINQLDPESVAAACAGSPTRYQAYSCVHGLGHAYMRAYNEELPLALRMCARLPRGDGATSSTALRVRSTTTGSLRPAPTASFRGDRRPHRALSAVGNPRASYARAGTARTCRRHRAGP